MDHKDIVSQSTEISTPNDGVEWPKDESALLQFSSDGESFFPANYWSVKDAFEGVQIFGGTGSGKTSGSGKALAKAFLRSNFGGLVLTAKTDEADNWREYAAACGREEDLIVVDSSCTERFNFLRYEQERPGRGAGHTENLVNLFCSVLETAERRQSHGGGTNDNYWQRTLKQLLRNSIDLCRMSAGSADLPSLQRIIASAPRGYHQLEDKNWLETSECMILLDEAKRKTEGTDRQRDYQLTMSYFIQEFPGLAEETRSVIISTFTSMADCFLRGMLHTLFGTDTTFTPEDSFNGSIIILDLPVKEFNELGQFSQALFKYIWQKAVERRIPQGIGRREAQRSIRPVFLWADESQFFVNQADALFQSTARSSRACTVYLTQNLPSYAAALGSHGGREAAESFLGNLQTKIFHANGDPSTNQWAADSIGKSRMFRLNAGISESLRGESGASSNRSAGGTLDFEYAIQPQQFTLLRSGGLENDLQVEAVIFQGGRRWSVLRNGEEKPQNFIVHSFKQ